AYSLSLTNLRYQKMTVNNEIIQNAFDDPLQLLINYYSITESICRKNLLTNNITIADFIFGPSQVI
ncbi:hypothetical protein QN374_10210, partial [Herbaspirillum sp. RTI4]|uniref:hypothetical protein n=1 Tax=Herbaspirillum sp. RTI4 TaxID=3048640 RepID=UPI002B22436B